ncbi:MAG: hypothetical protein R3Y29_02760 [bacterium]
MNTNNNDIIKYLKLFSIGALVIVTLGTSICILGANNAKEFALTHAGFSEQDISFVKWDFDLDNFLATYDIEWYHNNLEYEYKIHALTGEVLKYEID